MERGLEVGRERVLHPGPLRWLRAFGWMAALFLIFTVIYAGAQMVGNPLFHQGGRALEVLEVTAICLAGLGLYGLVVRFAEGRWPEELSLSQAPLELVLGLLIGALMLSAGGRRALWRWASTNQRSARGLALGQVAMAVESGVMEELLMRAIVLRLLMRAFGVWPALALQALLFGVLHLANPITDCP